MKNYKTLALELYKARTPYNIWTEIFTEAELVKLWDICQKDLDTPFDDEVYEALNIIGYWEGK